MNQAVNPTNLNDLNERPIRCAFPTENKIKEMSFNNPNKLRIKKHPAFIVSIIGQEKDINRYYVPNKEAPFIDRQKAIDYCLANKISSLICIGLTGFRYYQD